MVTAQKPQARVQRSPAIMKVAVPLLQHSQRFGHCASSQTVCSLRSEMSALVEKKTGFEGSRTLIQSGFRDWCRAGSILVHDMTADHSALFAFCTRDSGPAMLSCTIATEPPFGSVAIR